MKFLVALALVALVGAVVAGDVLSPIEVIGAVVGEEGRPDVLPPIELDYHNKIGIPAAQRIKAAEEALDFDGGRIVGGSPASLGQYPYLGGLLVNLNDGRTSVCGSSLLTNTRAVTAAHCWLAQTTSITVVLGSTLLFSGGTRVNAISIELHANYNSWTLNNDIAILTLPWVNYNNNIAPISLFTANNQLVGTWAWAAGFGSTGGNIGNNQFLSHVDVQVITNAVCQSVYGSSVIDSNLCVATTGGRGTCGGDSGGPLVHNNQLIGVTSFGHINGCQVGHPAGFARVSSFASWIQARL